MALRSRVVVWRVLQQSWLRLVAGSWGSRRFLNESSRGGKYLNLHGGTFLGWLGLWSSTIYNAFSVEKVDSALCVDPS